LKVRISIIGFLFSVLGGNAYAGEWSDYEKMFPLFPCSDGWTMCVSDGDSVGPGVAQDSEGNPSPVNFRFSFYTFEAMPNASPHSALSEYEDDFVGGRGLQEELVAAGDDGSSDGPANRVAEVDRPAISYGTTSDGRSLDGASAVRPSDAGSAPVPVDFGAGSETAASVAPVVPVPAPAPAASVDGSYDEPGIPAVPKPDYGGEAASGRDVAESPVVPVVPVRPVVPVTPPPVEPVVADAVLPPPPPPPRLAVDCDDLVALETTSMLGKLGVERRKCLDARLTREASITMKNKISRVLLSDAKQRGDKADWERLAKRHLEKIDRSDPDMCLLYAIHLHRKGVGKSTRVIKWSDYALENKAEWSGALHTRNVYNLHKLKSQAASRLWSRAEKKFVEDRNEKNESSATKYRSMAKQFSRAWLDYAKASGKDTSQPRAACVSASGNSEFCPP
jgi:hypothetical protein